MLDNTFRFKLSICVYDCTQALAISELSGLSELLPVKYHIEYRFSTSLPRVCQM